MPSLPPKADPVWLGLVTGKENFELTLLPAKLYLGRAQREVRTNPAVATERAAALHGLYEKFQNTPAAQKDIARLV